jgi:hypothetical protein
MAHIQYNNPASKDYSFEGVGVFVEGSLHQGPFCCRLGYGLGIVISQMINGRPADSHFTTYFFSGNTKQSTDSLNILSDVSGW